MAFQGPQINKGSGLDNQPLNKDKVILFVAGGVATAGIALNTAKRIVSLAGAEALGITAAYDATNSVRLHDHLKEAYRLAPNAEIILAIVAKPTANFQWFENNGTIEALLRQPIAKDVKYIFTAFNPVAAYTSVYTANGLDTKVLEEFPKAQVMLDKFFAEARYIDGVMLDSVSFKTLAGLQDLRTLNTPGLSCNIALDKFSETNKDTGASTGAVMGMFCARNIQEDLGSVEIQNPPAAFKGQENYPLDNGIRFTEALLVDGTPVASLDMNILKDLAAKGYIFAGAFADYPGIYLSGDPTASSLEGDFAWINHNAVWNKGARTVRKAMIPKIRSILKKNPTTGFLTVTTAEALAQRGQKKLDLLVTAGNCSAAKISINPNQTPSPTVPLVANLQIVINGILYDMEIDIALTNQITI